MRRTITSKNNFEPGMLVTYIASSMITRYGKNAVVTGMTDAGLITIRFEGDAYDCNVYPVSIIPAK